MSSQANATCWSSEPPLPDDRHAEREAHAAVGAARRAAADEAVGRGELGALLELEPEHRAVEQRRLVEVVERLRERDVVDAGQLGGRAGPRRAGGDEVGDPAVGVGGVGAAEEHRRAVGRRDRRQVGLVRAAVARQHGREQPLGALGRARSGRRSRPRSRRPAARPRRACSWLTRMRVSAVAPQLDGLRAVLAGVAEAHRDQQPLEARGRLRRDGQLDERVAAQRRGARQRGAPGASSSSSSERIASTAIRPGSAWRKTSLKTSSESGPS